LVERINTKILKNKNAIVETESYFLEDSDIGILAYGFTARSSLYAVKSLRKEGMKVGMLRLKTIWPFPEDAVRGAAQRWKRLVIPEMNRGQVAGEVRKACLCDVLPVNQTDGEIIHPGKIVAELKRLV
jgi:2-oxoglutarate ferredoxin oxidoreductase subunit alpha